MTRTSSGPGCIALKPRPPLLDGMRVKDAWRSLETENASATCWEPGVPIRALRGCMSGVNGLPEFKGCTERPKGVVGTDRVVVDRLSTRPGGEFLRDKGNWTSRGGSTTSGVEDAEALPVSGLMEKSSEGVDRVRFGLVTMRRSDLKAIPVGPREWPLKWSHSAECSWFCCDNWARSKATEDLDT